MRVVPVLLAIVAAGWPCRGADPPPVRLPDPPAAPAPMPSPPQPGAAVRLTADRLYVIDADVPVVVLASPAGLVTVSDPEPGPVRVRGRFVDSPTDRTETRTYKGKAVVTVEAAHTGTVEIIVVPEGAKSPTDVIRRTVEVDAGGGPRPPPVPPPGPAPGPKPDPVDPTQPVPLPGGGLRVLVVFQDKDAAKLPAGQSAVIFGKQVREYLDSACAVGPDGRTREWRIYDADTDLTGEHPRWAEAMARPRTALPWLVASNGKSYAEMPLPKTPDEFVAAVRRVAEAK